MMMTDHQCLNLKLQSVITGPDGISADTLITIDDQNIDSLIKLYNIVYNTGHIPTKMKKSTFVPLPHNTGLGLHGI